MIVSYGPGTRVLAGRTPEIPAGAVLALSASVSAFADSGCLVVAGAVTHGLKIGCNTIGRERDNDIVVRDEDLHISRRHCSIVVHTNGQAEIFDLASLNGTFVNGRRLVDRAPLRSNDVVRLGGRFSLSVVLYNTLGN